MSDVVDAILSHKKDIDAHLVTFLKNKRVSLSRIHRLGGDVIDRLIPFTTSGKTTRGSLAVYIYSLFAKHPSPRIYDAAAALELFHSGFLIHDDIMDKDKLRRGRASIWEQYRRASHNTHRGISQAINAGDLCFFLAQELLADVHLLPFISSELSFVAIAQMQDVENNRNKPASKKEILTLYRYKTARYTFSLSMAVGATVANAKGAHIATLMRLGESMGLLYQIRDDELSVYGDASVTGKPVGSDERNKKQTLAFLLNSEELGDLKSTHIQHCDDEIDSLPLSSLHKKELTALVRFCLCRNK